MEHTHFDTVHSCRPWAEDVPKEQEEPVADVDGKLQAFCGGPNSASAIAMLLSPFFFAHSNSVCAVVTTVFEPLLLSMLH
jgi:hypothetical protein